MRSTLLLSALALATGANAQYGTFDKGAVSAAKGTTTVIVQDAGGPVYNRALLNAVKANWKFTSEPDLGMVVTELAKTPLDPTKTYLMKERKSDPEKHDATFLALVQGWKMKKGETLDVQDNAVTNVPAEQELASIMIDDKMLSGDGSAMLNIYVKNLQDYLEQVETGAIKDKATADRLYGSRNRLVKDMELWVAKEQLDKSLPDLAAIQQTYTHKVKVMDLAQEMAAATNGQPNVALADVVITGDYKTKWCFRRIFNAETGELMYLRDEAALYDKKMGFIKNDFRILEQSR
jgi:hypothetical protein